MKPVRKNTRFYKWSAAALDCLIVVIACHFSNLHSAAQTPPTPPAQPATGPGGAQLPYASVTKTRYRSGNDEYWIYEPASPAPESAPLIVFLHGWSATNPQSYGAWIDHIVRRGNIVVYPRYQADLRTPPADFTANAIGAIKAAIRTLQSEAGHVRPELDQFALVGHSAGGDISASIAALAAANGLPQPKALMCVQPGGSGNMERIAIPFADLSAIPGNVLLLTMTGDKDNLAGNRDAKRIFKESTQVKRKNKDYVEMMTDEHGQPALEANHFAPVAIDPSYNNSEQSTIARKQGRSQQTGRAGGLLRARLRERLNQRRRQSSNGTGNSPSFPINDMASDSLNALDYYGTWKLFDGLCDVAFYHRNREYALGNTPEQRFMGVWSDGVPVKELRVTDHP